MAIGTVQMLPAAVARRGVVQLAGLGLGQRHQLSHVVHRQRRVHHQRAGLAAEQRDAGEVVDRVEGQLAVERGADGVGLRGQQQRVAVGRALGHHLAADRCAGTGLVLDDDLLLQAPAELLGNRAHRPIDRTARRERHDDVDRPRGEVTLRTHQRRQCE
jgi:hypothetical protein